LAQSSRIGQCKNSFTLVERNLKDRMWIVRMALSGPCTFMVLALLILPISPLVDVFTNIDIPIVAPLLELYRT
jgi:hypothetical protein